MIEYLKSLDGIDLEQDLDESSMRTLNALGTNRVFLPGEHLYRQGDPAREVYVLKSGSVKATSTHAHGYETLIKIHRAGSLLGLSALRPNGLRDANGVAIDSIETTSISRHAFLEKLESDGAIGILLVRVLLKRQQELHARIRAILGNSVEQRLAEMLLQLSVEAVDTDGDALPEISITDEDLAAMVISRRQYVNQILRGFVSRKLIAKSRGRVRVVDPEGLRQIAGT